MATLKDIAKVSKVSIATVSRVLNNKAGAIGITEETQKKVLEVAQQLNYQPDKAARNLRLGRSIKTVLFIYSSSQSTIDESTFFPHPFFSHMLNGIQMAVLHSGFYLSYIAISANSEINDILVKLLDGEINGVITWGTIRNDLQRIIVEKRIPLVAIEPYTETEAPFPCIYVDNSMVMRQAVEHLQQLGHRRIGFITMEDNGVTSPDHPQLEERRNFFHQWITHYGLPIFANQEVFAIPKGNQSDLLLGEQAISVWVNAPYEQRPTAAIAVNDLLAIGAIKGLRKGGLVIPEDISILGVDDIDWAQYNEPALSTVQIPKEEMGELAVALLERVMNGDDISENRHLVKTKLIERASTNSIAYK